MPELTHLRVSPQEKTYLLAHVGADGSASLSALVRNAWTWWTQTKGIAVVGRPRLLSDKRRK